MAIGMVLCIAFIINWAIGTSIWLEGDYYHNRDITVIEIVLSVFFGWLVLPIMLPFALARIGNVVIIKKRGSDDSD